MNTNIPLACSGHVLIDLPLFLGPVVAIFGWLWYEARKLRRRDAAARVAHDPGPRGVSLSSRSTA
jgi:hypothetical protein